MKRRFIWHAGDWVDVTDLKRPPRIGPYIIRDGMNALQHPATGEMMDSKSAFRRVTREHGLVEMGDQAPTTAPPRALPSVKADIVEAIQALKQGYEPPPIESAVDAGFTADTTRFFPT